MDWMLAAIIFLGALGLFLHIADKAPLREDMED